MLTLYFQVSPFYVALIVVLLMFKKRSGLTFHVCSVSAYLYVKASEVS